MMNTEAINNSLRCLNIAESKKEVGEAESPVAAIVSDVGTPPITTIPPIPILICDGWYGFPKQKGPRKERINAVSRQLCNFLEWRSTCCEDSDSRSKCGVSFLGNKGDVQSVRDRMNELESRVGLPQAAYLKKSDIFRSDVTIHEFLDEQNAKGKNPQNNTDEVVEVVYLSPDASHTLSTDCPPPSIVIIGMVIDRRITTDRSRIRAEETLKLRAARLPLDDLNVKELTSHEPLNVDTCMELMQRWWWNCDKVMQHYKKPAKNGDEVQSKLYKKCFLEAAAFAMKSQRERHPNRTVHNTR